MRNLSQFVRNCGWIGFAEKVSWFFKPEVYITESVQDYLENKDVLRPMPLSPPFSRLRDYGFVFFHGVQINAVFMENEVLEEVVEIKDDTGSFYAEWPKKGRYAPLNSYPELLLKRELDEKDRVYQAIIKWRYKGETPFIAGVYKYPEFPEGKKNTDSGEFLFRTLPSFLF